MNSTLPTKYHFENNLYSADDIVALLGSSIAELSQTQMHDNELSFDVIRAAMNGDEDIKLAFDSAEEYWTCEVWNGDGCIGNGDGDEARLALLAAYADYRLKLAPANVVLSALSHELNTFITHHGYDQLSADDLLLSLFERDDVPQAHLTWVEDFITRWDEAS
tara:strand:+ start:9453 stop:9941 length:489 start_codon:yes stop_codon:yes gene_type:complete